MFHLRRLARQALLASVLLVMVGWALAIPAASVVRAWDAGTFSAADESLLFSLTNQARAASGLAPLRNDSQLHSLAEWRAQDMSVRDYFSHQIPPQGYEVFHYMDLRGIGYVLAGENIGWDDAADDQATTMIQQMFMNSPEHRSNILGALWDSMGVGAYKGTDGKLMYCVLFKETEGPPRRRRPRRDRPRSPPRARPPPRPRAGRDPAADPGAHRDPDAGSHAVTDPQPEPHRLALAHGPRPGRHDDPGRPANRAAVPAHEHTGPAASRGDQPARRR